MINALLKSKTVWGGVALVASGIAMIVGEPGNLQEGIQGIIAGLSLIFLRKGVLTGPTGPQGPQG